MLARMSDVIAAEKVVHIHYTLKDADGEVLDTSGEGPPLAYLHGANNLVPGLERAMDGREVPSEFDVVVPAREGYGERGGATFEIPRNQFPDDAPLHPGVDFVMEDAEGKQTPLWILEATEDVVVVDPNHPLAGVDLHFAIQVVSVRDATAEELDHGHPHGPGGAH